MTYMLAEANAIKIASRRFSSIKRCLTYLSTAFVVRTCLFNCCDPPQPVIVSAALFTMAQHKRMFQQEVYTVFSQTVASPEVPTYWENCVLSKRNVHIYKRLQTSSLNNFISANAIQKDYKANTHFVECSSLTLGAQLIVASNMYLQTTAATVIVISHITIKQVQMLALCFLQDITSHYLLAQEKLLAGKTWCPTPLWQECPPWHTCLHH